MNQSRLLLIAILTGALSIGCAVHKRIEDVEAPTPPQPQDIVVAAQIGRAHV